jgi:hypothetical protein
MAKQYYVRLPYTGTIMETERLDLWPEAEVIPAAKAKEEMRSQAVKELRTMLKPGATVYTVLRHCSASGMSRRIDLFVIRKGCPVCITSYAAKAMGDRVSKDGGIVVGGCGMDMGFHLVYNLGRSLWPNGASKGRGSKPDTDGGYALNHRWL